MWGGSVGVIVKRHMFQLGLFLLLGAILNVAVAWGCAALIVPEVRAPGEATIQIVAGESPSAVRLPIDRASGFGTWRHRIVNDGGWRPLTSTAPRTTRHGRDAGGPVWESSAAALPGWSRLGVRNDNGVVVSIEIEAANGWPLPAMWCSLLERWTDAETTTPWRTVVNTDSAIVLKAAKAADLVDARALPILPV